MTRHSWVCRSLRLGLLILNAWLVIATGPLRENPEDVFTTPGQTVVLRCALDHPSDRPAYVVYWYRHNPQNAYLTQGGRVFHQTRTGSQWERLTVVGDTSSGEYHLQIAEVALSDAGDYSCVYFEGETYRGESHVATITVYEPPDEGYPRCSIEPAGYLEPGQDVVLTCVSSGGDPKPRLDWMSWHEILPGKVETEPEPKSTYRLRLMETDNGAVFTCIENTPATAELGTCSVKPLHRTTNVTLATQPADIGRDAVFACAAAAMPAVSNYTWTVSGARSGALASGSAESVSLTDDRRTLRIADVRPEDNGTVVTCFANNEINEEGSATAEILIAQLLPPPQPGDKKVGHGGSGGSTGDPTVNAGVIAGSVCFLILLILLVVVLVRKLVLSKREGGEVEEGEKAKARRGETVVELPGDDGETEPLRSQEPREQPSTATPATVQAGPRPVTICLTPRDAIVEHIRETEEAGGQPPRPAEDGSRVKVIGRLSCAGMTVDVGDFSEMYSRPVKKPKAPRQADVVPDPEPPGPEPQPKSQPRPKPQPKPKPAAKPASRPPLKPKPKVLPKPSPLSTGKPVEEYREEEEEEEEEDPESIYENTYRRPDITMNLGEETAPLRPRSNRHDDGQPVSL